MAVEPDPDGQESAPLGVYTETLARLYWRQGYLDEALRIYRHLADEHPDEPMSRLLIAAGDRMESVVCREPGVVWSFQNGER